MSEDELTASEEQELRKLIEEGLNQNKVYPVNPDYFAAERRGNGWCIFPKSLYNLELPCENCQAPNAIRNETCLICGCKL